MHWCCCCCCRCCWCAVGCGCLYCVTLAIQLLPQCVRLSLSPLLCLFLSPTLPHSPPLSHSLSLCLFPWCSWPHPKSPYCSLGLVTAVSMVADMPHPALIGGAGSLTPECICCYYIISKFSQLPRNLVLLSASFSCISSCFSSPGYLLAVHTPTRRPVSVFFSFRLFLQLSAMLHVPACLCRCFYVLSVLKGLSCR